MDSMSSLLRPACRCNSRSPLESAGEIGSSPVIVVCDFNDSETGLGLCFGLSSIGFSPVSEICAV